MILQRKAQVYRWRKSWIKGNRQYIFNTLVSEVSFKIPKLSLKIKKSKITYLGSSMAPRASTGLYARKPSIWLSGWTKDNGCWSPSKLNTTIQGCIISWKIVIIFLVYQLIFPPPKSSKSKIEVFIEFYFPKSHKIFLQYI